MSKAALFESVKMTAPNYNTFDLSHDVKLSTIMGRLTPIMVMDCIPGDKIKLSCEAMIRFAPLIAPVMHRVDVYMHYFFVPNRILWKNWEYFISSQPDPDTGLVPAFPTIQLNKDTYAEGSLSDYLGLPNPDPGLNGYYYDISAIPFAAYQAIYHEYYRDQNLIPEFKYQLNDGDNMVNASELLRIRLRAWEHDYFTSALPFAQKGTPVSIPLGDIVLTQPATGGSGKLLDKDTYTGLTGTVTGSLADGTMAVGGNYAVYDPAGTLQTEATTINDLRRAMRLRS